MHVAVENEIRGWILYMAYEYIQVNNINMNNCDKKNKYLKI